MRYVMIEYHYNAIGSDNVKYPPEFSTQAPY